MAGSLCFVEAGKNSSRRKNCRFAYSQTGAAMTGTASGTRGHSPLIRASAAILRLLFRHLGRLRNPAVRLRSRAWLMPHLIG
jgi:hypothetical protein